MDPIAYKKIMCNLTSHNFRGKCTIFQQPNIIFPRAAYRRLQVYGVFGHPNIWAKYEGGEVQRPNHSRTPTRSRTTRSLYVLVGSQGSQMGGPITLPAGKDRYFDPLSDMFNPNHHKKGMLSLPNLLSHLITSHITLSTPHSQKISEVFCASSSIRECGVDKLHSQIEDETEDIPEVFRKCSVGNVMRKVIE